ncbi:hypothetical protein HYC85_008069 [Camellia sinensis]|uniref:Uncharacterized protein n=1 Tax=Camellia sinensis TaxID=4442 RepID=A0A7J7HQU7_CAMSI|nr:hypothetical protein HYC85_008069 [Camellia sinensis]
MLEAKSLRKAMVPCSLLEHPSPGSVQSTRLALHVNADHSSCWVYIASGCRIYKLQISMQDSLVNQGKESLLIPEQTQCFHAIAMYAGSGYLILGSVDSYGHLIVSKLDTSGKDVDRLTFSVSPRDCGVGEGGWAGLCFSPSQWSMAAVAHSFCRSIDVYDQDIHLQTLRTLWYPSSLSFMQSLCSGNDSSILAVTEGCQLSIWDLRMKENGGCVRRIYGSVGDIFYAVCSSSTSIAVGGADRTVTVYDPRRISGLLLFVVEQLRMRICGGQHYRDGCTAQNMRFYMYFWEFLILQQERTSMLVLQITGLAFASIDSDYIYIQGVDYEVLCGQWKESKKVFSFRGDSNWLGFSKCTNKDVLGGWCDSGSIFVADIAKENKLQAADDFCNEVIC